MGRDRTPTLPAVFNIPTPRVAWKVRPDSLLEGTGFELLVPRGDGLRWVSLQFAVASRLSQQGLSCRQLQNQRRVIRNPGNPLLMG
jgi:hypothetical protein